MCSESEDKSGKRITCNHTINIQFLTTNTEIIIVWHAYLQEEDL